MGRKLGCVIKKPSNTSKTAKKVMPHDEFIKRINKTLYFGNDFNIDDDDPHAVEFSKPLVEYASELFSDSHRGYTLNRLNCVEACNVLTATPTTLIMALIYLDRLNVTDPGFVRRVTPHELFIVSMMISTKLYVGYDEEVYLSDFADYGDMTECNLKKLELKLLTAIDWNIYISNEQFFEKLTNIERILANRQGLRRGWLTYSELIQMLPSFTLAKFLLQNITMIVVSYAAGVMTLAGALFLAAQIPGTSLQRNHTQMTVNSGELLNDTDVDPADVRVKGTSTISTSLEITMKRHNHTNMALNVENELLKLERQYRDEALRDSLLQKNNEISTESRLTLPQQMLMAKIIIANQKSTKYGKLYQQQSQWFANKDEYSDCGKRSAESEKQEFDIYRQPLLLQPRHETATDEKCTNFKFYNNSTIAAMLWQFLADAVKQTSSLRPPYVWLKLM